MKSFNWGGLALAIIVAVSVYLGWIAPTRELNDLEKEKLRLEIELMRLILEADTNANKHG